MRHLTSGLRSLVEGRDEQVYVLDPIGMARLIALSTPDALPTDDPHTAAGKAIRHLRLLSRRRSLLAKAFRLASNRSRSMRTVRDLRRRVERAA